MPIFDFKCKECGHVMVSEHVSHQEMRDKEIVTRECPKCKGESKKQFGSPPFYFRRKGSN